MPFGYKRFNGREKKGLAHLERVPVTVREGSVRELGTGGAVRPQSVPDRFMRSPFWGVGAVGREGT